MKQSRGIDSGSIRRFLRWTGLRNKTRSLVREGVRGGGEEQAARLRKREAVDAFHLQDTGATCDRRILRFNKRRARRFPGPGRGRV